MGLILTIYVMIKSNSIDKKVSELRTKKIYNQRKNNYIDRLRAIRTNILEDGIKQPSFLKESLQIVHECKVHFSELFSWGDKLCVWQLERLFKKNMTEIDFNEVANKLSLLIARLTKTEEEL